MKNKKEFDPMLNQQKRVLKWIIQKFDNFKKGLYDNVLNDEEKKSFKETEEKFKSMTNSQDKYIEENKDEKIIGYDPKNFMPIYKDIPKWENIFFPTI